MNRTLLLLAGYGVLVVVAAADLAWLYPQLPERVATKFGAGGEAARWSSRSTWLTVHAFTLGFTVLLMIGLRFLLPLIPASLINIPHRDYWLAPERSDSTRSLVGDVVLGFGLLILAFLVALQHLLLEANVKPVPRTGPGVWWALGLYLAAMAAGVVWLYVRFRRPR